MMNAIDISVVMSVYNDASRLAITVDSILAQRDVAFEVVIVDDGSTDESGQILDDYAARDARLRVIHQENVGLTRALIRGCAAATGIYIARHDAGDTSAPDRLAKQLECARAHPTASLISCGTRFVGPAGETLYEIVRNQDTAQTGLLTLDVRHLCGPSCHPSTVFPRHVYERVGGYRPEFYFAQDIDLWMRLAEYGEHVPMPDVLYETVVAPSSISGGHRSEQIATADVIIECARLRRSGQPERDALARAERIRPRKGRSSRAARAAALYFVGECLRRRNDPRAARYFREALEVFPFHVKSLVRLVSMA